MTDEALDPFDPAALRLDQTFTDGTAVKKLITTIPVRKPSRQDFVRVHPDLAYRFSPAAIIEFKDDRELYLVTPTLAPDLVGEFAPSTIFTAINRQGVVFLWPVKLPTSDAEVARGTARRKRRPMSPRVVGFASHRICRLALMKYSKRRRTSRIPNGPNCHSPICSGSPSAIGWSISPIIR